jgi:hypothetical protein
MDETEVETPAILIVIQSEAMPAALFTDLIIAHSSKHYRKVI